MIGIRISLWNASTMAAGRRTVRWLSLPFAFAACLATAAGGDLSWTGFRGRGDSHAVDAELPLAWSDTQNLAWTCALEGYGQSSPVIWGDTAYLTAVKGDNKQENIVVAVALSTGKVLWQQAFPSSQTHEATDYVSRAAPTPVVDAEGVYAFFESGDLVALTPAGESRWSRSLTKDYGEIKGNHGLGGSPAQTAGDVIVLVEHDGPSYLAALDKKTGQTRWKHDRPARVSWSSPVVVGTGDSQQILISSNGVVQCCQAATGEPIWEVTGLKGNTVASPSVAGAGVLVGSGQPGESLLVRGGGTGDVSATHVAWKAAGASSSFGSPLVHDGRAYFVNKAGAAYAVNLETGETLWTQRLPDSTWASPVAAGDRVYFFCKNGVTVVARAGDQFESLAQNALTIEGRLYGVAIAQRTLLLRSSRSLACIRLLE